jgi:rubrerythrin
MCRCSVCGTVLIDDEDRCPTCYKPNINFRGNIVDD